MRAINHALTGSLIGLVVGEPVIAVPTALASHFVCDMIPHHGSQDESPKLVRSRLFRNTLLLDAALCAVLVLILVTAQPLHWQLAAICALVAASPDFLFINRYLKIKTKKTWRPSRLVKLTQDIQWFQRPLGAAVEVSWFVAGVIILMPFLS